MTSWVITGANRGIGFGFVQKLGADPENIIFALTRNKDKSTDLLAFAANSKRVHVLQADITDVVSLRNAAKEVEKITGGKLNNLINNGAYLSPDKAEMTIEMYDGKEDQLEEDFDIFFKVNAIGVVKTTNVFLPLLRKTAESSLARVITISTPAASGPFIVKTKFDNYVPYAVSKAATNMVVAKYAARFKEDNFLFAAVSPGNVYTGSDPSEELKYEVFAPYVERLKALFPEWNGRAQTPEESVTEMLNSVAKMSTKDTGVFVSHHGDENWL